MQSNNYSNRNNSKKQNFNKIFEDFATKNNQTKTQRDRQTCPICGIFINSIESLKVHMQYQHEDMNNRWNPTPTSSTVNNNQQDQTSIVTTTSTISSVTEGNLTNSSNSGNTSNSIENKSGTNNNSLIDNTIVTSVANNSSASTSSSPIPRLKSPLDSENNNQPNIGSKHLYTNQHLHHLQIKSESPLNSLSTNNTISAAADSSDNQPSTPQPGILGSSTVGNTSSSIGVDHHRHQQSLYSISQQYTGHPGNQNLIPNQDMHPYPAYMHGYDQFYHPPPPPPTNMDYTGAAIYPGTQQPSGGQDYKLVPSSRYHPYVNNSSHHMPHHTQSGTTNGSNTIPSSSISNSSLSPRVVSSSSPTQNSLMSQQSQSSQDSTGLAALNTSGQPDPSPSPKQCDKCGFVCPTDVQLSEHYTTVHGSVPPSGNDSLRSSGTPAGNDDNVLSNQQQYPYQQPPYIKEEPGSDILDLDSQKMVYPPQHDTMSQDQPLPPMHSMHPMHRPLMWGADMHTAANYMPQPPPDMNKPYYPSMKQTYPVIKSDYGMKPTDFPPGSGFGGQMIKSEYHHQTIPPQTRTDLKAFNAEIPPVNNPVSSSPSEFPSTTTPQENGSQFRGFEPPSSSLPNNPPGVKATTWKSNEARRPKTYNCTACNKWFTSSGHLKRHYNTTLHKNAVKSSGQPDPATMPISAHHHPSRDPNHKSNRRNNAHSQQPPPAPPEPPRSPDYTPQYTPPPGGFSQQSQFQSYPQQMGIHSTTQQQQQHSASNGHPNGQAGPSVQASQPRGLLIISSSMEQQINSNNLEQEDQVHSSQMPNNSPREELYHHNQDNQQSELMLTAGSPNHNNSLQEQQDLQEQQQLLQLRQLQQHQLQTHIISHHHHRGHIREDYRLHHHQGIPMPSVTSPTIHSTIIHHNTIMDHQQQHQYINPLGISTTSPTIHTTSTIIPSYQLQQQQVEHQNYHTIIGNDLQFTSDNTDNLLQIHSPFQSSNSMHSTILDDSTSPFDEQFIDHTQLLQHHHHHHHQQQQTTADGSLQIVTNITTAVPQATILNHPTIVEVARISGGEIATTLQENQILPYSPVVPEYLRQSTPTNGERSPQEADIPPPHQSASAPLSTFPYSPTSTITAINFDSINNQSIMPTTPKTTNCGQTIKLAIRNNNNNSSGKKAASSRRRKPNASRQLTSASGSAIAATGSNELTTSPIGKIECIECGKEFAKICYLTQHNKTFHSGEQPFRCQKCGKRFPSEVIYDTHLAKHKAQDKPYKCDKCPKQFHHKTDLRRHRDGHTGYKAHICDTCSKGFCRKDHLRKHSDTHKPKPAKKKQLTNNNNNINSNSNDDKFLNLIENTQIVVKVEN